MLGRHCPLAMPKSFARLLSRLPNLPLRAISRREMKLAALGPCLLAPFLAINALATEWKNSGAKIDELVADTSSLAPTGTLSPLAARIPFVNFRYPHVDALENVTFIADDPLITDQKAPSHGIYRSYADGRFEALISTKDTPIPGSTAKFEFLRGLQMADNGTDFAFSGYATDRHEGIYFWQQGVLRCIARSNETILPGDAEPINEVGYASVGGGMILYTAGTATAGRSLVGYDIASGRQTVLLRTGLAMPGAPGETFRYFSAQNWTDGGQILFRAARVSEPNDSAERSKANYGLYGWMSLSPKSTAHYSPGTLRRFVDWQTPVPDLPGKVFTRLNSAPFHGSIAAFVGNGANFSGIYWLDVRTGILRSIVDTETSMEGLFPGTFQGFTIFPSVQGQAVVFVAWAQNYAGVFLYRTDRDELFVLADTRSKVEGKTIAFFEMAGHCFVGNRFAVKVAFNDKSQGVFLATLPANGFTRSRNVR